MVSPVVSTVVSRVSTDSRPEIASTVSALSRGPSVGGNEEIGEAAERSTAQDVIANAEAGDGVSTVSSLSRGPSVGVNEDIEEPVEKNTAQDVITNVGRGNGVDTHTSLENAGSTNKKGERESQLPFRLSRITEADRITESLKPLNYRPMLLENGALIIYIAILLAWTGFLISLLTRKTPLQGNQNALSGYLWGYIATGIRFLALQQGIGLGQIMPYCSMGSRNVEEHTTAKTVTTDYYPYDYPVPRIRLALNGHWFYFLTDVSSFISTFGLVQFSSNILQESWDGDDFLGFIPNRGIVYIVIACNALLLCGAVLTFVWLWERETGLFTEPGSIALLIGMLGNSNVREDFKGMDGWCSAREMRRRLARHYYSAGYFKRSDRGDEIVYTIGRADDDDDRLVETTPTTPQNNSTPFQPHILQQSSFLPWFLHPLFVTLWIGLAITTLTTALTLLINDKILTRGFKPHAPISVSPALQMSAAGFWWSFLPAYIADLYRMLWKNTDCFYRLIQPYADLHAPQPADAVLTLNYPADLPIVVTIKAIRNGHYKLAFLSLLSLASSFTTALAANMFYVDYDPSHVPGTYGRIAVSRTPFLIILAYFGVIVVAFGILMPDHTRRLPHDLETLADRISFLWSSSLAAWPEFLDEDMLVEKATPAPAGKGLGAELWAWCLSGLRKVRAANPAALLQDPEYEREVKQRFMQAAASDGGGAREKRVAFGVFKGEDDAWHVGIEAEERLAFLIA